MPPSVDAALYASVGRYAGAAVLTVFEQVGGIEAMADWAKENPTDFYKGPFAKIISAPKEINVTGKISIEDAVRALDLEEGVDYTVVEPEEGSIDEHRLSGNDLSEEQF
jgi:hypothetical protein